MLVAERLIEMAGLQPDFQRSGRHFLLRPIGLRYQQEAGYEPGEGESIPLGDDPTVYMVWDGVEIEERSAASTTRCIWDFVALLGRPLITIHDFVSKWGLYNFGEDMEWMDIDKTASMGLIEWVAQLREVDAILKILAATEAEELVPVNLLSELDAYDTTEPDFKTELKSDRIPLDLDSRELQSFLHDRMLERWTFERQRGQGLALQRAMITRALIVWSSEVPPDPVWDESGRRLVTEAYGVRGILAAKLVDIFTSTTLDVFICSVCARPFSFEVTGALRRPKLGAQRFCSDSCRTEAKRQANLASWHRNKNRWSGKGGSNG